MDVKKQALKINRGATFTLAIRWAVPPFIYKPISGIDQTAPARVNCPTHGLKPGWPCAIVSVEGMTQINAEIVKGLPREKDYHKATVIDGNTVDFNTINSAQYDAYTSGGFLQYYTPKDITGAEAEIIVKNKAGGSEIARWGSDDNLIAIDAANHVMTVLLPDDVTEALTWKIGIYEFNVTTNDGLVTPLYAGPISVSSD